MLNERRCLESQRRNVEVSIPDPHEASFAKYTQVAQQDQGVIPLTQAEFGKFTQEIARVAAMSDSELAQEAIRIVKARAIDWNKDHFRF